MTTKLFNEGQRNIEYIEDGKSKVIGPKKLVTLSDENATYLKKLFPDELVSMEDQAAKFEESDTPAPLDLSGSQQQAPAPVVAVETEKDDRTEDEILAAMIAADEAEKAKAGTEQQDTKPETAPKTGGIFGLGNKN